MGAQFGITLEGAKTLNGVLANIKELKGKPQPALKRFGERMKGWTADSIRNRRDPATGAAHKPLGSISYLTNDARTKRGRLLNSIVSRAPKVTREKVSLGSNMAYANIQQEGGTIRPKNSKYLAIPLTREAARSGSARRWMDKHKNDMQKPFFLKTKSGNALLATSTSKSDEARDKALKKQKGHRFSSKKGSNYRRGKLAQVGLGFRGIKAHFLLLKKVTVPARPYMGFPPDAEDMLVRDFEAYANVLVNAAKGGG